MSARFAGSRSVDERRRRRLASGADNAQEQESVGIKQSDMDIQDGQNPLTKLEPIGTLFPKTLWKAWLCVSLLISAVGGILYLGILTDLEPVRFPAHWSAFLDLHNGPLVSWVSATLLLLAGQLAIIIGWARSCSIQDFSGRYRIWNLIACGMLFGSLCVATGLHVLIGMHIGQLAAQHMAIPPMQQTLLGWLIPAFVIGALLMTRLDRELRGHFTGLHCVWLGVLMCVVVGFLPAEIYPAKFRTLIPSAATVSGHLILFVGLYLHCRYVIHVCPDPAPVQRLKLRLFKLRLPALRLPRLKRFKPTTGKATASKQNQSLKGKLEKTDAASETSDDVCAVEENTYEEQNDWDEQEELPAVKRRTKRRTRRQNKIRIDQAEEDIPEPKSLKQAQPIDPELLKGLSKRERRKLRKQMRDEQRATKRGEFA